MANPTAPQGQVLGLAGSFSKNQQQIANILKKIGVKTADDAKDCTIIVAPDADNPKKLIREGKERGLPFLNGVWMESCISEQKWIQPQLNHFHEGQPSDLAEHSGPSEQTGPGESNSLRESTVDTIMSDVFSNSAGGTTRDSTPHDDSAKNGQVDITTGANPYAAETLATAGTPPGTPPTGPTAAAAETPHAAAAGTPHAAAAGASNGTLAAAEIPPAATAEASPSPAVGTPTGTPAAAEIPLAAAAGASSGTLAAAEIPPAAAAEASPSTAVGTPTGTPAAAGTPPTETPPIKTEPSPTGTPPTVTTFEEVKEHYGLTAREKWYREHQASREFWIDIHPDDVYKPRNEQRRHYKMTVDFVIRHFLLISDPQTCFPEHKIPEKPKFNLRASWLITRQEAGAKFQNFIDSKGPVLTSSSENLLRGQRLENFDWWGTASYNGSPCYNVGILPGEETPRVWPRTTLIKVWGRAADKEINRIRGVFFQYSLEDEKALRRSADKERSIILENLKESEKYLAEANEA